RSDCKNLVEFTSKELFKKQPMAWQVFDVRGTGADTEESRRALALDLLGSPVLYLTGHHRAPDARDREGEVLKEYLANGGCLLAGACCGAKGAGAGFDRSFRELMARLYGKDALQPLDRDHPIWLASGKFAVSPDDFKLEGVKQGCKTIV